MLINELRVSQISFANKITSRIQILITPWLSCWYVIIFICFYWLVLNWLLSSCSMLHLRFDGNKVDCKLHVLMSWSPIVSKLETTWQSSEKFCFGILFVNFLCSESGRIDKYLDICKALPLIHSNKERCSVTKVWELGKSKASQKAESDRIPFAIWKISAVGKTEQFWILNWKPLPW